MASERQTKIENAIIDNTMLGVEDHGITTAYLFLSGDSWGCGFGGYTLDGPFDDAAKKRKPSALMGWWVARVLETLGVEKWESLKGVHVRAETEGLGGGVVAVGHFLKDRWFRPKEEIKAFLADEDALRAHDAALRAEVERLTTQRNEAQTSFHEESRKRAEADSVGYARLCALDTATRALREIHRLMHEEVCDGSEPECIGCIAARALAEIGERNK